MSSKLSRKLSCHRRQWVHASAHVAASKSSIESGEFAIVWFCPSLLWWLRREAVKTAVMIPVAILRCVVALVLLIVLAGLSFTAALGWCGLVLSPLCTVLCLFVRPLLELLASH